MTTLKNLELVKNLNREILIGLTKENKGITLNLQTIDDMNIDRHKHFSISANIYDLDELLTEEQGEDKAREYLEDGELWRENVQAEKTISGLVDWVKEVINVDGWKHIVGDVVEIGQYDGEYYYVRLDNCGQCDLPEYEDFRIIEINREKLETIRKAWKELHLKPIVSFTKKEVELVNKVAEVFENENEHDSTDFHRYIGVILENNDVESGLRYRKIKEGYEESNPNFCYIDQYRRVYHANTIKANECDKCYHILVMNYNYMVYCPRCENSVEKEFFDGDEE